MRITIEEIGPDAEEEIFIRCREVSAEVLSLVSSLKTLQNGLVGFREDEIHRLSFSDIFYFEVVDSRSFFYCRDAVFESRLKLYEFETLSQGTAFFRASKSTVLNADKIDYVSPSFSGRFEATLCNGEKVVVSRQYVGTLKKKMGI